MMAAHTANEASPATHLPQMSHGSPSKHDVSSPAMPQHSAEVAIDNVRRELSGSDDVRTLFRAGSNLDGTSASSDFILTAFDAAEERQIKSRLTATKKPSTFPANMTIAQVGAMATARARRAQRVREANEDFEYEIAKIGRPTIGLLDLSAELRNLIYHYALIFPNKKCVFKTAVGSQSRRRKRGDEVFVMGDFRPGVGILATCRLIYKEASPIMYGANNFSAAFISGGLEWESFGAAIGRNIQHIHELKLRGQHELGVSALRRCLFPFHETTIMKKVAISIRIPSSKDQSWRDQYLHQLLVATKGFVAAQFQKRVVEARAQDKLSRQSQKLTQSLRASRKVINREQAVETLKMLRVVCPVPSPGPPLRPLKPNEERYKQIAEGFMCSFYDQLARVVRLIGKEETLKETGAYDWRAGRK